MATSAAMATLRAVEEGLAGLPGTVPIQPGWRAALGRLLRGSKVRRAQAEAWASIRAHHVFQKDVLALLEALWPTEEAMAEPNPVVAQALFEGVALGILAVPTRFAAIEAAKQACVVALSGDPGAHGVDLSAMLSTLGGMELGGQEKACQSMALEAQLIADAKLDRFAMTEYIINSLADSMNHVLGAAVLVQRRARARAAELAQELAVSTPLAIQGEANGGARRL